MEGESFLGLEVRANDGTDLGRVTDVITDGATGEVKISLAMVSLSQ